MDQISSFSLIIPAYNEEKRLPKTLEAVCKWAKNANFDLEILVMDDGSTDKTAQVVKFYVKKERRISLIRSKANLGKMPQVLKGFKLAKKEIIGVMDADGAADPEEFFRLFSKLPNANFVLGSRYLRNGLPPITGKSLIARLISKGSVTLFRLLFKVPVYDAQIGFKIYKRAVLKNIIHFVKRSDGFTDTEIVVKAFGLGYKIEEVPIIYHHASAHSKINRLAAIIPSVIALVSIWLDAYDLFRSGKLSHLPSRGEIILRLISSFKKND